MNITLSEQPTTIPDNTTLFGLKNSRKPTADIVVLNGAVVGTDRPLQEGDSVNLIQRGEVPSEKELEALLVARHTPGVHQAVKAATVGIAGLGGLGSTIAVALVRTGIGKLVLADFDVIEPTNLNRQQYNIDQLGLYKADALRANLEQINPYVSLETHVLRLDDDNIGGVFSGVDVMVEAFDSTDAKAMLLRAFPKAHPGTPVVAASGLAGSGPSNTIRTRRILKNLYLVGDEDTQAEPGMGLMAPRVGIAASHQANAVLRLILGEDPAAEE
ncbi:MAG: sulfur carrier protein ThiS adenylyltransferase ThiF [Lentisphaerae bacterium]|nr:sulfur carrier protein ThiS adenylyltransferase ThiF [Lentisphaerota bacterium]MBT4816267.1 sulfur carrier protein ThiS adenylyltransferase ThiF [Lentisphaerota bacterium]MBT5608812.1 sulfur carrier protein ThiS adenylyltransferase ThiF [Lentisphaerota bacterium]MBT7059972.1 sulfur carrier protein ThiS adenylyltransferase ThiF [Lentisphaerota bacterium]MBT7840298.1 sulfur carrier protein ThiS adenylyltransferase ThiF [Lentisphaerota bacterium]